jgi:hypothetical protein
VRLFGFRRLCCSCDLSVVVDCAGAMFNGVGRGKAGALLLTRRRLEPTPSGELGGDKGIFSRPVDDGAQRSFFSRQGEGFPGHIVIDTCFMTFLSFDVCVT